MVSAHDQNNAQPRDGTGGSEPTAGHHAVIAQPHTEPDGPNAAAAARAAPRSTRGGNQGVHATAVPRSWWG